MRKACRFSPESGLPIVKTPVYDYTIAPFACSLLPAVAALISGSVYMLPAAKPRKFGNKAAAILSGLPIQHSPRQKLLELGGGCAIFRIR